MIQYIIAAGIGAFLGSQSKKSKKSYAEGGKVELHKHPQGHWMLINPLSFQVGEDFVNEQDAKDYAWNNRIELTNSSYAKGGIITGAGKSGLDKIKKTSKDNPSQMYKVTDDNYSNIGNFYLKNGKFAKKTVSNADYDFAKNKVSLRPKSDVIYKATEIEGKGGYFDKGGETKVKYDYIPQEAIDDLSYTMDKVSKRVSGSNILSGAYVKSASKVKAKTKSASKVKAKIKGSSDLRAKILAMMTDGEGNKKVILATDVKEMQKYISDKLITAFYLGLPKAYDFKGEDSYSGGLVNYEEDYAKKIVVDALKNIKANKFELGLKYPQYNFEKLLGKPIIKDIEGKSINFSSSTRTYKFRLWIWKDCVIGQTIGMTDSKDGYSDYTYGQEPTLMGGYKSVQTSKASKLESIAKFMAKDKDGYLKDNDVLYNGLGGADFDSLDKNKIEYAEGGELEKEFIFNYRIYGDDGGVNDFTRMRGKNKQDAYIKAFNYLEERLYDEERLEISQGEEV